MTKKITSAQKVSGILSAFQCPICASAFRMIDCKSLICADRHTFDIAKQGYLNLMDRPSDNRQYNRKLFEARRKIIAESRLYHTMHKAIAEVIGRELDGAAGPRLAVDLGCGEGSHLQMILDEGNRHPMIGVGLDLSKDGILMAAKTYSQPAWIVGDLANAPLADHAFHVILNILSPSNYAEFKRILAPGGLAIKAVPRPHYLKELREALFTDREKQTYANDQPMSLFKSHFHLLDVLHIRHTQTLHQTELADLVQMTPLAWSADPARIAAFIRRDSAEITIDLDLLIGKADPET